MTFCYQRPCEDPCYSPCGSGSALSAHCSGPALSACGSLGYSRRFCGYRQYYPAFSPRYCSPYSSCYLQRYSYGSCYPCYPR